MTWSVWRWNGHYIMGELLKEYKTKKSAIKYAEKNIKYSKMVPNNKDEIFLEDEDGMPIGILIKRKEVSEKK
jgi:hypothetical protein